MKKIIITIYCLLIGLILSSCSDWTDIESVNIEDPRIQSQNPELYAQYLANLRDYKKSNHKLTYVWYDNSVKVPFNRAQHIECLPDSVDVVVLMCPDNLVERELKEIDVVRKDKGMKVVLEIDYDDIKFEYEKMLASLENADEYTNDHFVAYILEKMQKGFKLSAKYNYDGIVFGYKGKNTSHMTDDEKLLHLANERVFMGVVRTWYENNPSKNFIFEGNPQFLLDKTILPFCKNIIVPCTDLTSGDAISARMELTVIDGVPNDRFIVSAETISLSPSEAIGWWSQANKLTATRGTAQWIAGEHTGYNAQGIAIYNVINDYYNPTMVYQNTRTAINIMNPPF